VLEEKRVKKRGEENRETWWFEREKPK